MPLTADPDRVSEQPCLGDGSYSSMPEADVDHPGSAHCHLEAAPASSRSSFSISSPPLQCHTRRPQGLRPLLKQLLKRQSHLPKLSAPTPSTHLIIYIYFKFLLCISLLLLFYEIPSF